MNMWYFYHTSVLARNLGGSNFFFLIPMSEACGFQHVAVKQLCLSLCIVVGTLHLHLSLAGFSLWSCVWHQPPFLFAFQSRFWNTPACVTHFPPQRWLCCVSWVESPWKAHPNLITASLQPTCSFPTWILTQWLGSGSIVSFWWE